MDVVAARRPAQGRHRASPCCATSSRSPCRAIGRARSGASARSPTRRSSASPSAIPRRCRRASTRSSTCEKEGLWHGARAAHRPDRERARRAGRGRVRRRGRGDRLSHRRPRRARRPPSRGSCPPTDGPRIVYPGARSSRPSAAADEAQRFLDFLRARCRGPHLRALRVHAVPGSSARLRWTSGGSPGSPSCARPARPC